MDVGTMRNLRVARMVIGDELFEVKQEILPGEDEITTEFVEYAAMKFIEYRDKTFH